MFLFFTETHALVCFVDEDSFGVVPISRIKNRTEETDVGSICSVLWSDKKLYEATLILTGICCVGILHSVECGSLVFSKVKSN